MGYNDLVADPRSFFIMGQLGYPVVFDIEHTASASTASVS